MTGQVSSPGARARSVPAAARPVDGLVVAIANLGVLLELSCLDAPPGWKAPFLLGSFAVLSTVIARRYIRAGRLVATPALILYALMTLYSVPVVVSDILFNFAAYRPLADSALVLALALSGMAVVLLAFDDPGSSSAAPRILEEHHLSLLTCSIVMLGVGVTWLYVSLGDLNSVLEYCFESNYYQKHIKFHGKAFLGLFTLCFEQAGLIAALGAAIPRASRKYPLAVDAAILMLVALVTINQGYRTTIVLITCQYLVARSLWPGHGIRVIALGAILGVMAPAFLMWAYVRHHISTGGISDLPAIIELVSRSNWANIHDSEIGVTLVNGGRLISLLESGAWEYRWGETIVLDPFIAMIPRAIWPDRPEALQIAFTRSVDPTYAEGGTLSFSFSLEGYLNFGIVGALAWSGILVWALVAFHRRIESRARQGSWRTFLVLTLLCPVIWFYIRDDFGDVCRRALISASIALVVITLAGAIVALAGPSRGRDRPGRPRPPDAPADLGETPGTADAILEAATPRHPPTLGPSR